MTNCVSAMQACQSITYLEVPQLRSFQEQLAPYLRDGGCSIGFVENLCCQFPGLKILIQEIKKAPQPTDFIHALYVFAGLKPSFVTGPDTVEKEVILSVYSQFPNIKIFEFGKGMDKVFGIVNEYPLFEFDPRRFVSYDEDVSLLEAMRRIPTGDVGDHREVKQEQRIAYLLGYGPTCEDWICHLAFISRSNFDFAACDPEKSVFLKAHYLSLGKALNADVSDEEAVVLGKAYVKSNIGKIPERNRLFEEAVKAARAGGHLSPTRIRPESEEQNTADSVYMTNIVGSISFKTDYVQQAILYRQRLLDLFSIPNAKIRHCEYAHRNKDAPWFCMD